MLGSAFTFLEDWATTRLSERDLARRMRNWRKVAFLTPTEVTQLANRRLANIVQHAFETVPFWRKNFQLAGIHPHRVHSIQDLANLQPIDRSTIQTSRDDMVSTALEPTELVPARTGGSSTVPLSFLRDSETIQERRALQALFSEWAGQDLRDRSALVWGASFDITGHGSWRSTLRDRWIDRRVTLSSNQLDPSSIDEFLVRLQRFNARVLHGYAHAIWRIACHIADRRYRPVGLVGITVTAEPLSSLQRKTIEDAFHVPVFNHYGAREIGMVAAECSRHRGLHVALPSVYCEILRRDGTAAEPGELGEIIVTDLFNRAMPFLRYRIGDLGAWAEDACDCGVGFPLLRIESGKTTHYLVVKGDRLISGNALVLSYGGDGFEGLYLRQEELDSIEVLYLPSPNFAPESLKRVRDHLVATIGPEVRLKWRKVDRAPLAPSGKVQLCYSTLYEERLASTRVWK